MCISGNSPGLHVLSIWTTLSGNGDVSHVGEGDLRTPTILSQTTAKSSNQAENSKHKCNCEAIRNDALGLFIQPRQFPQKGQTVSWNISTYIKTRVMDENHIKLEGTLSLWGFMNNKNLFCLWIEHMWLSDVVSRILSCMTGGVYIHTQEEKWFASYPVCQLWSNKGDIKLATLWELERERGRDRVQQDRPNPPRRQETRERDKKDTGDRENWS